MVKCRDCGLARRVAFFLIALVLAIPLPAQDAALLQRDSLWNSLRLSGNAAALAPLLADDWLLTHSDGRTQDKADYLADLATRRRSNSQVENIGVRVRQYANTAIVTGISVQSGVTEGQPWSGRFRFTRTWVRRDGVWLMVASHSSRCAEEVICEGAGGLASRVDSLLAPLVAANEFSGAVVLMRGGSTIYARAFGIANHSEGLAFTPDTPVDGASLAKTFTAAGIWLIVHEGKVTLDSPVQRYVPEYPHAQTTVGQLLAHSNGLPASYEFFDAFIPSRDVRTTAAMLGVVATQSPQPLFPPGTQYEYSNLGYDAAGLLIERITGQTYEAFVRERFFTRLGMRSSFARPARFADWKGVRTIGYQWRNGAWAPNDAIDGEGFFGASNLYYSAADLARWGSALASAEALPAAVFEAGQQHLTVSGKPLDVTGLSWHCDAIKTRCSYNGHHAGFHSFVFWDRSRNESAVFVSNSTLPAWTIASLQRELVNALSGRAPDADPEVTFMDVLAAEPAEVDGPYTAADLPALTVRSVSGGGIKVRVADGLEYDAYPAGTQVLYVPGLDYFIAFSGSGGTRALHVKAQELSAVMRRTREPTTETRS